MVDDTQKSTEAQMLLNRYMILKAREYIDDETDDEIIKTLEKAVLQSKPVDMEGLKKPVHDYCKEHHQGWNDCIDHLHAKGYLRTPPQKPEAVKCQNMKSN